MLTWRPTYRSDLGRHWGLPFRVLRVARVYAVVTLPDAREPEGVVNGHGDGLVQIYRHVTADKRSAVL